MANIEHMAVSTGYWATDLRTVYGEIARLQREPKEALRAWGAAGRRRPEGLQYEEGEEYEELIYDEMMMMEGMGRR